MRQINRWSAMIGIATLLLGIGIVVPPGLEVRALTTISQIGSDINGEAAGDNSGSSVAMSADGTRIAIGADRNDDNGINSGQVRIYTWNGTTWTKTGADINGETTGDNSGYSVAMSADGSRIAIGAPYNDGSGDDAGHVRIYTWNGNDWQQTGDDINGEAAYDNSGSSVAMSADGSRIAIGATGNDGYGVNSGHVRIYTWNGNDWQQTGDDINGEAAYDRSGHSVAMSADGSRIAIGAPDNDGNGITAGHVRIFGVETSPAAPTISSVATANGSLTVSFTAGTDGGSPITNYKYSIDSTNYIALNPATTTSPFTINGLTNGTTYSVSIKAVNEIGDSAASSAVTGIPVAPAPAAITTTIAAPTTTVAPPAATTTTTVATAVTVAATKKVKKTDSLPETGDNSSMVVMIAILFAMTGLVLTSRRRIRQ